MCDFLLVININLRRILHRFRDTAFEVKNRYILLPLLGLTLPTEGFPWDDLHKIFCASQRVAKVPNAVEKLRKVTTTWVGCMSVTDERETDDRWTGKSK